MIDIFIIKLSLKILVKEFVLKI